MEHLRAVARADGVGQEVLAREVAMALSGLEADPLELVTLCRRIVSKQPSVGALWTLCARVLCSTEPEEAAWEFVAELEADRTGEVLFASGDGPVAVIGWTPTVAPALAAHPELEVMVIDASGIGGRLATLLEQEGLRTHDVSSEGLAAAVSRAGMLVLEAEVAGPTSALVAPGSYAAAAVARHSGVSIRLAVPVGRMLPRPHYDVAEDRSLRSDAPWASLHEVLPLDLVDDIARSDAVRPAAAALRRPPDGPIAPELDKRIA